MINSCLDVHSGRLCLCGTSLILAGLLLVLLGGCRPTEKSASSVETRPSINVSVAPGGSIVITTQAAEFDILPSGDLKAFLLRDGSRATLDDVNMDPVASESLVEVGSKQRNDFRLDFSHVSINDATSIGGARGKRVEITGKSASLPELQTTLSVEAYEDLPNVAVTGVSFKNTGASQLVLGKLVTQSHVLNASGGDANIPPYGMWSFHGSSEAWGKDDVVPITKNFIRHNPMQVVMKEDENRTGGGLPIVALWTKATGLAIGSAEKVPLPLGIPVYTAEDGRVHASVVIDAQARLKPGEVYSAPLTFVAAFQGDFYEPLSFYSKLLQQRGWSLAKQTDADYQANWCGWGYGMDFTPQQMVGTIPKLKELGLKWATLDARWFDARGDWEPRKDTLPGDSLQRIVRAFHDAGLKLTVWWIPIVAEDGHGKDILDHRPYTVSDVVKAHPDWLILDQQGKPARAAADMAALCPALPEVQEYTRQVTKRLIGEWDFDGSKLDFRIPSHPVSIPSTTTNHRMIRSLPWVTSTALFWKLLAPLNRKASRKRVPAALRQISLGSPSSTRQLRLTRWARNRYASGLKCTKGCSVLMRRFMATTLS